MVIHFTLLDFLPVLFKIVGGWWVGEDDLQLLMHDSYALIMHLGEAVRGVTLV